MEFIKRFFADGSVRSLQYKKNSILILVLQVINIISSFLIVTVVLSVLGVEEYGVWVTITTIVAWFSFLDVGLGHGLRNYYAKAKAEKDISLIKKLISTTFFTLVLISLISFAILLPICYFINWASVLNAPLDLSIQIRNIMILMVLCFGLRSVFGIGLILKSGDQDPYLNNLVISGGNLLALILAYLIVKFGNPTLLNLGISLSLSQVIPYFVSFIVLFTSSYRSYLPNVKNYSKSLLKNIYSIGFKFFLVQILNVILLQSNILIIAHIVGQKSVTEYNIAYKYLWPLMIVFTSVVIPLWSASTEAFFKNDLDWLRSTNNKLKKMVFFISIIGAFAIIISPFVYKIWLKGAIKIDFMLMVLLYIYFVTMMWYSIYRMFMNGVGKIRLQYYVTLIQSVLHIPLAIFMCYHFSIYGIILCMIFWNLINCLWEPKQYEKIMKGEAKGIWFK